VSADDQIPSAQIGGTRTLLAAAIIGTGGTLLATVLGLARAKVLAVELDPDGLGLYGQIFALLTALSALTGLGLGLGATKVLAAARARNDRRQIELALNVSLGLPIVVAVLLAVAIAGSATALAPLLLKDERVVLILVAALAVPFVALQGPLIHALQGFRDVKGTQAASVIFAVVLTLATAVGAVFFGLDGAIVAFLVSAIAYAVILYLRLRAIVAPLEIRLRPRRGLSFTAISDPAMRGMLAIGFASLTVGVVVGLGDLGVRTLLLRSFDEATAGIYQALSMMSNQFIGVIAAAVSFFIFTTVSEAAAANDRGQAARRTDDAIRLGLLLTLPLIAAVGLLREQLVPILLSEEFKPMVDEMPLALTGDALRVVAWIAGASLIPLGLTRWWMTVAIVSAVAWVGVSAWLVPERAVGGTMIGYVVFWAVAAGLTVIVLSRAGALFFGTRTIALMLTMPPILALIYLNPGGVALGIVLSFGIAAMLLFVGTDSTERHALLARIGTWRTSGSRG
jgi:O-antigen/teichoic acid export membrane protein